MPHQRDQELPPPGSDALDAWVVLQQAYLLAARYLDQFLARTDISYAQTLPLLVLHAVGQPLPMTQLARYLVQEPQSLTSLADRLEKRGLLVRGAHPTDRRVVLLSLTPAGSQLADTLRSTAANALRALLSAPTASEHEQLVTCLRAVATHSATLVGVNPTTIEQAEALFRSDTVVTS